MQHRNALAPQSTGRTSGANFPKKLLHLESDRSLVFASHDEFLSHHLQVTAARASQILSICTPNEMCDIEMSRAGVKEAKL